MKRLIYIMLLFLAWPLSVTNAQNQAGNTIIYQCKNEKLANALRRVERLSDYYRKLTLNSL